MTEDFRIGQSPRRREDDRLLRGQGRFTDDIHAARETWLYVLRSPHGFARISRMDTEAARAAPDVFGVVTGEDLRADGLRPAPSAVRFRDRSGKPVFVPERHALVRDTARFVGDPVAAVFARSLEAARDAAELIEIEWQDLDPVTDPRAARSDGAPQIWDGAPGNAAFTVEMGNRDAADAAFARAKWIARLDSHVSRVSANPLEPRVALAEWDPGTHRYTLTVGTHMPHTARDGMAAILGIGSDDIRIIAPDLGGSFGMKDGMFPEYALTLWGARTLGRPVRWRADRSESLMADHHARDVHFQAELALDTEGRFTALRSRSTAALGAYISPAGSFVPVINSGGMSGVYRTPAIHAEITGVFTNTAPTAPYRGAGRPEAAYVIERLVDIAAVESGIDRMDLRRRNMIPASEMPYRTGFVFTYDFGDFPAGMEQALKAAGWTGFAERRAESAARGMLRGFGLANSIEILGGPMPKPFEEHSQIRFSANGSVTVTLGTKSHGQGHETAFTQLMVETFGISPDKVRILTGDTDVIPGGRGSFGSRTLGAASASLGAASERIIAKGKRIAAHLMEGAAEDVVFEDGTFRLPGTNRTMSLDEVAAAASDWSRLPADEDVGLSASAAVSASAATFPNGAHVCEVEVDPETGAIRLLSYLVVDDIGRVIHPEMAHGQMHGGIAQGVGQAMMEHVVYGEDGQLLTGSFTDYAMPRASDLPRFSLISKPVLTKANPLGAKGVGESGTVGSLPAFVNAVVDAVAHLGITHLEMPLSPSRVWQAIRDAQEGRG